MTTRLIILLAAVLCWAAPAQGQTIKALSYDTTNGTVIAGTNRIAFTNKISLPSGGNTNDLALRIGTANTGFYVATSLGTPAAFVHNDALTFAASTTAFVLYKPLSFAAASNAATTRTNLGLGSSITTNLVAGTNTLVFSNGILTGVNP